MSWTLREVDEGAVEELQGRLGVLPVTARCLAARGFGDVERARTFLRPKLSGLRPPAGLAGLEEAIDRLVHAVKSNETVGCFGDYDVDGITTCTIFSTYLKALGVTNVPRVASRHAGYGFTVADAEAFADAGCSLIVTGDCGTSDTAAIEAARARNVDVLVVDHHTVPEGDIAAHPARAVVNPFRKDSQFPFRGLASAGLAFYVIAALRSALKARGLLGGKRGDPDPRAWLDLVAVGTIADLVPLADENRILTANGLKLLARQPRPGLLALLRRSGAARAPIDERTVGWQLGPRINAPGRLGDARPALELMLAEDAAAAEAGAAELEQANSQRRVEQARVLGEALEILGQGDPGPCVVVAGTGWPSGVVGIVAAKLVDRYNRPAFVIAVDEASGVGRGSARSAQGVNLYDALAVCAPLLDRFGGHAAAAGLTVSAANIDAIRTGLHGAVKELVEANAPNTPGVDAEVGLEAVHERLLRELSTVGPFGKGNEEPVLAARGLRVKGSKKLGDGSHLKMDLAGGGAVRPAIAFGFGPCDPGVGATIDVTFAPVINYFAGRRQLELEVRQFKLSESSDQGQPADSQIAAVAL